MNILTANWPKKSNVIAFTTLKSCNLEELKLPENQLWLKQEHGNKILDAGKYFFNKTIHNTIMPHADGSYTIKENIACIVKTADCLPILVMDASQDFIAAIHAGWKGLANGIIDNFFAEIKPLHLNINNLLFWLGPAIGPLAFEVGEEVYNKFSNDDAMDGINYVDYSKAFNKIINQSQNSNKYLANIYHIAKINLSYFGVKEHQIFTENWCTYSRDDLFYSYRKNPINPNRMYSIIWIE